MSRPKIHPEGVSRQSVMRAKRRAAGVCIDCGVVAWSGPGKCSGCRDKARQQRRAKVARQGEAWRASLVGQGGTV